MFRKESALSRRLRSGGLFSSLAAAGAAAAVSAPPLMTASAAIIYSGVRNLGTEVSLLPGPPASDTQAVNLDGAGDAEFFLTSMRVEKGPLNLRAFHSLSTVSTEILGSSAYPFFLTMMNPLEENALITGQSLGEGAQFLTGDRVIVSPSGTGTFFGFRFNPSGAGPGQVYGWGRLRSESSPSPLATGGMTLVDWAYEDTGAPIRAGQVPEPGTAVLLAMAGLAGAGMRRRRGETTRTFSNA